MNSNELRYLKECLVGLSYDLINTHCLFNKSKFDPKVSKASSSPNTQCQQDHLRAFTQSCHTALQ